MYKLTAAIDTHEHEHNVYLYMLVTYIYIGFLISIQALMQSINREIKRQSLVMPEILYIDWNQLGLPMMKGNAW